MKKSFIFICLLAVTSIAFSQEIEDFESGDFSQYQWVNTSEHPWVISSHNPWEGQYCMKSGSFTGAGSSSIEITVTVPFDAVMSFYQRISAGYGYTYGYDYGEFYIDGNYKIMTYGDNVWEKKEFHVSAGTHTYQWVYNRMGDETGGEDSYYIDYVTFYAEEEPFEGGWIGYDNGDVIAQFGDEDGSIDFGVTFPYMSAYQGLTFDKMSFYCVVAGDYTLNIYLGGTQNPETLVYTKSINIQETEKFVDVELDNQIQLDDMRPLWITMTYVGYDDPCACAFYCGETSSCMVRTEGDDWMSLADFGWFYSLMVRAHLLGDDGTEVVLDNSNVIIYPNPASNYVKINAIGGVEIINAAGQIVYEKHNLNGEIMVSTENFEAGIYFVKANNTTQKLIIRR